MQNLHGLPVSTFRSLTLKFALVIVCLVVRADLSHGQTSKLYLVSSPNVAYPVGTTYVYQNGNVVQSWAHSGYYELSIAVAGGSVRQNAVDVGVGTEYTLAGAPTGVHYTVAPDTYDATSDGNSIYGWNLVTATLTRYDLNWNSPQTVFSLGANYSYSFMGITYDPQNNSIWLAPWGDPNVRGYLYNYSLTGQLLGTLALPNPNDSRNGLAYDPADNTLWVHNWMTQSYEHYSKAGVLLGTISGFGRIYGAEFQMVPEPSTAALLGIGLVLRVVSRGRARTA